MKQKGNQDWIDDKVKIIRGFGTITAFARHLGCSTEAVRKASKGGCRIVQAKMRDALEK